MVEFSKEERICIPEAISFDKFNLMLIAYLKAGADEKAVSYRDASIRSGVSHTIVSANNKFFVYAGLLVEEARGRFKLTQGGAKYAQLLDWGRLEEAKDQLKEILGKCSLTNLVLDYVSIGNEVTRDDLRKVIGSEARVTRAKRFTTGINALIDMLVFSELLQEEGDTLKIGMKEPESKALEEPEKTKIVQWQQHIKVPSLLIKRKKASMPISLTINVADATDVEKLREILRAIKEELLVEKESLD